MKNFYKKYSFIVFFKDGTEMDVEAQDEIEAEHVAGLAHKRAGNSSAVKGVARKLEK